MKDKVRDCYQMEDKFKNIEQELLLLKEELEKSESERKEVNKYA